MLQWYSRVLIPVDLLNMTVHVGKNGIQATWPTKPELIPVYVT